MVVHDLFKQGKKPIGDNKFVKAPKVSKGFNLGKRKKLKILNLYCGIGGNRKLWKNCKVTAVEYDPEIAKIYQEFFPNDKVIVGDAHKYLLENFNKFDFIWASPPCPSHSSFRFKMWRKDALDKEGNVLRKSNPIYPSMILYEEIIFLSHWFEGKYIVENTSSYYEPLIEPQVVSRHYIWANFKIPNIKLNATNIRDHGLKEKEKGLGFRLPKNLKISRGKKEKILNNCVHPKMGKHILNCAKHDFN